MWATDGSVDADRALACVEHVTARFHSSVRVVHIARRGAGTRVVPEDEDEVLAKLRSQTTAMRARGLDAALHVIRGATGSAAPPIAQTALAVGADLVIVGTRGRSPIAGALLGSVTLELLHLAPCPVIAVPALTQTVRQPSPDRGRGPAVGRSAVGRSAPA